MKMLKMTLVQFGLLVLAICISAQATQNVTNTTESRSSGASSTLPTEHYSTGNSTTPSSAGILLHAGTFSVLNLLIMAAPLLQLYC